MSDRSPRSPAVASDAESAQRRLEALREEFAAYEREAERLRSMLRRALGLDPPDPAASEPPAEESPRLNGEGK